MRYGDVLGDSRIGATINVNFALYVDVFQFHGVIAIVELVALPGVPFKFDNVLKLHLAGLAVVEDHHDLSILLLLLERLLLVHQQMLLQIRILRVRLGAQWTGVRTNSEVYHLVLLEIGTL